MPMTTVPFTRFRAEGFADLDPLEVDGSTMFEVLRGPTDMRKSALLAALALFRFVLVHGETGFGPPLQLVTPVSISPDQVGAQGRVPVVILADFAVSAEDLRAVGRRPSVLSLDTIGITLRVDWEGEFPGSSIPRFVVAHGRDFAAGQRTVPEIQDLHLAVEIVVGMVDSVLVGARLPRVTGMPRSNLDDREQHILDVVAAYVLDEGQAAPLAEVFLSLPRGKANKEAAQAALENLVRHGYLTRVGNVESLLPTLPGLMACTRADEVAGVAERLLDYVAYRAGKEKGRFTHYTLGDLERANVLGHNQLAIARVVIAFFRLGGGTGTVWAVPDDIPELRSIDDGVRGLLDRCEHLRLRDDARVAAEREAKARSEVLTPSTKNARTTTKPRDQRTNKEGRDSVNKVKTLFVAANPTSTSRLAIDEEFRDIQEKIRAAEHRDAFEMIVAPAARPDDIEQALLQHKPVIVHFSGHGSDAGGLVFHGESGRKAKLVDARAIGELFRLLKKNVRIVVLNACYSKAQAKAIVREIDFVVGMKDTISDLAARKFAASFYRGLGFGQTIGVAFGLGVNALKREGLVDDENVPVLLVRSGMSANVVLLDSADGKRVVPAGSNTIEAGSRPQPRRNISVGTIPIIIDGDDYMRRLLNIKIDALHLARQVSCRALMQLLNARMGAIPGISGACESVEFVCSKRRIGSGGRNFSATQRSALLNRIGGEAGVYVETTALTSKEVVSSIGMRIEELAGSANCVVLVSSEPHLAPILRKHRHMKAVVLDLCGDLPNDLRNQAYATLELENDLPGLFSYSYPRFDVRKLDDAACAELYAEADDNHNNQLRVTRNGTVFMSKDEVGAENIDNLRFRFETYCAGNGYVGPVVASKPHYVQEQLADIRNAWETGRTGYIDY